MDRQEAIEYIRRIRPINDLKEALEVLIPELQESDDERIRKALLYYHKNAPEQYACGCLTNAEVVAWLEKQGEQKIVDLDEETRLGLDRALQIVTSAKGKLYSYQSDDGIYECDHAIRTLKHILDNGVEQKPVEWSDYDKATLEYIIEDIKELCDDETNDENIKLYKRELNLLQCINDSVKLSDYTNPAEWSEEDERMLK